MSETRAFVQLLRKMGHDMRVPLNTLMSTSDMLAEGVYDPLTPRQSKAVARLRRNNQRLLAILDDFVTYVKANAGEIVLNPAPFAPRPQLDHWCNQARGAVEEKGIALAVTTSENVPETLIGDENILSRAVLALVWNAVGFTSQGTIHVTSEWTPDQAWLVSVNDTGSGISDGDLPHIFEPFWRGEERPQMPTAGAGLGLPMAAALAKLMNGSLFLKATRSNEGSTFCLQVPLEIG